MDIQKQSSQKCWDYPPKGFPRGPFRRISVSIFLSDRYIQTNNSALAELEMLLQLF